MLWNLCWFHRTTDIKCLFSRRPIAKSKAPTSAPTNRKYLKRNHQGLCLDGSIGSHRLCLPILPFQPVVRWEEHRFRRLPHEPHHHFLFVTLNSKPLPIRSVFTSTLTVFVEIKRISTTIIFVGVGHASFVRFFEMHHINVGFVDRLKQKTNSTDHSLHRYCSYFDSAHFTTGSGGHSAKNTGHFNTIARSTNIHLGAKSTDKRGGSCCLPNHHKPSN